MEWMNAKETILQYIKKYRYLMLFLMIGLMLLQIPEKESNNNVERTENVQSEHDLRQMLEDTLCLVKGAGKVSVLLTQMSGEEIIYQTDENRSTHEHSNDVTSKTLLVTGENREETGLIRQINPPVLQGALIVCQGGDDPQVKYAIVEAVMRLTGLPSNRICVLKMK